MASAAGSVDPENGLPQSFTIRGERKWRTHAGLRIGMPESEVEDHHIWAKWHEQSRFYEQGYWLVSAFSPFGDGSEYPVLSAQLRHGDYGKVWGFSGWIGAAGE